jgi:hypothetical protein
MIIVKDDGLDEIQEQLNGKQNYHGFPTPYEVTLAYSGVSRQLTITPIGVSFDIWVSGVKITKTGVQTSTAHANTTGTYFITYDAAGDLNVSDQIWSITDPNAIPVCALYYNADLQDGLALFELHTATRNLAAHSQQHHSIGTFVASSTHFSLSGFTINGNTDADVTYGISSGTIYDEDIKFDIDSLADNGPYTILRRTGATNWTWTTNNIVPYLFNTNTDTIQRNGVVGGLYDLQDVSNNDYVNYYLFASSMIDPAKRLFIIPSNNIATSATAAAEESVESLNLNQLPVAEFAPIWKITFRRQSSNVSSGRARLTAITRLGGSRQSSLSFSGAASSHNTLSGRSDADSHPAAAITFTPYQYTIATDVNGAIRSVIDRTLDHTHPLSDILSAQSGSIPYSDGTQLVTSTGFQYDSTDETLSIPSLAGTGNRAVYSTPDGVLTNSSSDARLKTNVAELKYGLNEILQLNPISFNHINLGRLGQQREIGLLAQDVETIMPELVSRNSNGYLSLDYPKLNVVLINAVKELKQEIDSRKWWGFVFKLIPKFFRRGGDVK